MAKEKEMENNSNEKERRKQVQKLTMQVLAVMTLAIILYTVYGMVTKTLNMMLFGFMLGGFVVIYLIMSDIVEPYRLGMFQELTEQRRRGFLKMMLMDVIGAGALLQSLKELWKTKNRRKQKVQSPGSRTGNKVLRQCTERAHKPALSAYI